MPIAHLFAEGVGPFKSVHLDFRGPDGHPALGPHILAGVNGSGKSTLLKAIAWCLAGKDDAFPTEEWSHSLRGHIESRAMIVLDIAGIASYVRANTVDESGNWHEPLSKWVAERLASIGLSPDAFPTPVRRTRYREEPHTGLRFGGPERIQGAFHCGAAYSSVRSIRYVERPDMGLPRDHSKRFGFESTVQNEAIQSWLLGLYSKSAIAKERHESSSRYVETFSALERGLQRVCGEDVSIVVDIEPSFQPRLRIGNQTLNFSQIPDGVKATLGWLADFMMRADGIKWDIEVAGLRPGLLLFDEIEGFLHPLWQRRLLPALREALPTTQSIVTSHSPFVISSCAQSIIHVLKVNRDGSAYSEPPVPAPIGESITSTLKDIFGVDSRFDVETEEQLGEWNELNKARQKEKLSASQQARFRGLTQTLASRSEELRSLVNPVLKLPKAIAEIPHTSRTRKPRSASR